MILLTIAGLLNASKVKKEYKREAFIDTFLMDEFSYAHKYFKKGK